MLFNNVTVDGYFAGPLGEIDWFKVDKDDEFDEFSREQSKSGDTLIFGRTTYELMRSYWPMPDAIKSNSSTNTSSRSTLLSWAPERTYLQMLKRRN